ISRSAPPNLRALVLGRDNYQCSFVSEGGTRCACRSDLEVDHIIPAALGGKTEPENLRTLCAAHNRYEAGRVLGEVGCA
ncbi:MAG: HNH endonuclease, partial [Proteobacteria bacterium]